MSAVAAGHSFRRMQVTDLADVMRNERRAYTHPWTQGIFNDCIRSGYDCWLIEMDGRIVGHGVLSVAAGDGATVETQTERGLVSRRTRHKFDFHTGQGQGQEGQGR